MDRRILIQVTAPAVIIGLLLFATCVVSAWIINQLQSNITTILSENVTSLETAQEMQVAVRRLHSHCFQYSIAPEDQLLTQIDELERAFPSYLRRAERAANSKEERVLVERIKSSYENYHKDFQQLRADVQRNGPKRNYSELADDNPILPMLEACTRLLDSNKDSMTNTSTETERVGRRMRMIILLLGLGGPLSGLIIGWSVARGLSKSITRLSVRVQDAAQRLQTESEPISVRVSPEGEIDRLDHEIDHVVLEVEKLVKRMQRQQRDMLRAQQLASVGQLAASVAHEIRNPLMSIKMLVEAAARSDKQRPFTPETLEIVHREIVRLEKTVQTFLEFTRPPALVKSKSGLAEVVDQAIALVDARARQQGVTIETEYQEPESIHHIDREQVCTVLVNLFLNALDAMPNGGPLLVRVPAFDPKNPNWGSIEVLDSGTGLPPEIVPKLFTPFVSSKATGTGLGLCISKRIVEEHGGTIEAGNRDEGGAWFRLTFPAHKEVHA